MAEAVIGSIAEKIVEILGSQVIEIAGKLWGVKHELKALRDTISILQPVLDHAEEQYHQIPHIRVWVEKLKDAFYEAHDVLEEINIEGMRRELRGHNEMMKEVRKFFSSSNQLAFKLKMSDKVRAVRMRIEAIKADRVFDLDERPKREWRNREETHSFILKEAIIGRDDDKKKVMKFLEDSNVEENVSILPIVGIGGLGKTVLAKYVYGESKFDLKMWVCVSFDFDVQKIVKKMLACAKKEEPTEDTMELLQSKLRKEIDGKKYLLVLDDVWNINQETWWSLKTLVVGGARGSKILITTRITSVAEITGTTPPHCLKGLPESASLALLMQMAGRKIKEIQESDILAIGKEIVRKCSGVPLVVRTVGSLLFFKKSKLAWLNFKDYELPEVSQKDDSVISVLRLSYDHLPSHLKQCFAFCSLFPKDYEIKMQTLVDLWMAEGFIKQSSKSQHLEDIAFGYFKDLLWSNFFQDYQEDEGSCKMHDLMHDLACSVAGTECWMVGDVTKSINERTRHISHGLTSNLIGELPISCLKASALRTFLSTTRDEVMRQIEPTSEAYLHQLIQSFKRLRIFDLCDTNIKKVPRSIYKLKHLTYLDLSGSKALKRLPNSITRLQNLQTLNLNDCSSLEELPKGIRKLVSLRNLYIDRDSNLTYLPRGLGGLSSLHRLTRFILPKDKAGAKNYCGLGELNGLNNIRGRLVIKNLGYVTDVETESKDANLIGKHSLESLVLLWSDFDSDDAVIGNRDETLLDGLRPHSNLQKLIISKYQSESFPRWMMDSLVSFLPNLIEVQFRFCGRCKCLPPLGQLPSLELLYIDLLPELEYIELGHSSTSTASFSKLSGLRLHGCEKLKAMPLAPYLEKLDLYNANAQLLINQLRDLKKLKSLCILGMKFLECLPEECFQSLTSLESLWILDCHQLTSLSQGMRHLTSLVDLHIGRCEELDITKDERGNVLDFHGLHSLRSVEIYNLPKPPSLPQWLLQAINLEHLDIWQCGNLKDIPEQIEALRSLQRLGIRRCPLLTSLPEGMRRLTSLIELTISSCPKLKERCERDVGEDWDKIKHIPNIRIPCRYVCNSHYLIFCDSDIPAGEPIRAKICAGVAKIFSIPLSMKFVGPYYCGVRADCSDISNAHYTACLYAGVKISGTNGEVMPDQYQVKRSVGIEAVDHIWCSRGNAINAEQAGVVLTLNPKPIEEADFTISIGNVLSQS
ncbi:hypothetical protein BT93_B0841 [Corymbia citriodora subsp. variegata]|nr:hypothetical protein BT93_B0841 [Corymbia citriodora subsp. variegata]